MSRKFSKLLKMAKVKFSALISEMRNKLNGSVFARNRGGAYLRTKVTPLNPQSSAQVAQRSLLASLSQAWRTLTEAQREAWKGVVSQWARTDVFGDVVNPSGSTLFIRLNLNILNAGGTRINTPPAPLGASAISDLTLNVEVTGDVFEVGFSPASVPAGHAMIVESTPCLSAGISNANAQFRQIGSQPAATATGVDMFAEQTTKFGALVAGQKIFIRAKFVRLATGEVSQTLVASAIVGA